MKTNRRVTVVLAAALGLFAASCSKQSVMAPAPPASALSPAARTGLAAVHTALDSRQWQSLDALSLVAGPARAAGSVRAIVREGSASAYLTPSARASLLMRDVAKELSSRIAGSLAVVIPPQIRGTTYVFDAVQHRYVADPTRPGGPENGVRYILYAVNPLTHEPVVREEIGYADLTDEGNDPSPNTASLRLRAVSGEITFADYSVSVAGGEGAGEVRVHGAFFDGSKHLAFEIVAHARGGETSLAFTLSIPEDGFALNDVGHAVASPADSSLRVEQAIQIGENTFAVASVQRPNVLEATVVVDGALFARIHGDASTLLVFGADGATLSPEQREGLARLLGLFDGVGRMVGHLLEPVGALFAMVPRA